MSDQTIPLKAGGAITVCTLDHARHGLVYLSIEGTKRPDEDGVASLDDAARWALIAALSSVDGGR